MVPVCRLGERRMIRQMSEAERAKDRARGRERPNGERCACEVVIPCNRHPVREIANLDAVDAILYGEPEHFFGIPDSEFDTAKPSG